MHALGQLALVSVVSCKAQQNGETTGVDPLMVSSGDGQTAWNNSVPGLLGRLQGGAALRMAGCKRLARP